MNKVTTIHLNGKAYQMEESAYDMLRTYLDDARAKLENNPDKDEILQDVEQAMAEKCNAYLNQNKNVLTQSEIENVIREMGPVEDDASQSETKENSSQKETVDSKKKLYKIKEGAMILGVCNGIAAYFDIDVTLVRIVCVALTILTGGGWVAAYIIAALIIPYAHTAEQHAAAHGTAFNAQELIDHAKKNYADMKANKNNWKREWRENKRKWKREMRQNMYYGQSYDYHYHHRSSFWETIGSIFWLAVIVLFFVFLYHHVPATRPALDHVYTVLTDLWYRFLNWLQK